MLIFFQASEGLLIKSHIHDKSIGYGLLFGLNILTRNYQ